MKHKLMLCLLLLTLFALWAPAAMASNTWYVHGVNGNDNNDCMSPQTACKTIGHAGSLASPTDTISIAPATYTENLGIGISLKLVGANPQTTIVDGNHAATVIAIAKLANVTVSNLTIRNGQATYGGGISNSGSLTLYKSIVSGNTATLTCGRPCPVGGGGIVNYGVLTVNRSTINGNQAYPGGVGGGGALVASGAGIYNKGRLTITNSTISGNEVSLGLTQCRDPETFAGGGLANYGAVTISSTTFDKNLVDASGSQGNICIAEGGNLYGPATLQNTILEGGATVGDNSPSGDCYGTISSLGYNLSDDQSCNFTGPGDLNDTVPKLGLLNLYGGTTPTVREYKGSPTIDAGNPAGCTDNKGHLLTTDQRGEPRPGKSKQDKRCDMGAFEIQAD